MKLSVESLAEPVSPTATRPPCEVFHTPAVPCLLDTIFVAQGGARRSSDVSLIKKDETALLYTKSICKASSAARTWDSGAGMLRIFRGCSGRSGITRRARAQRDHRRHGQPAEQAARESHRGEDGLRLPH